MSKIYDKLRAAHDEKEQKASGLEKLAFWAAVTLLCAYFWYIVSYAAIKWLLGV